MPKVVTGNIVDIFNKQIFYGAVTVEEGKIAAIEKLSTIYVDREFSSINYILPGFIDSHVHIESSMLIPSEFAKLAVVHGTVATISDPHEIANVCGMEGVQFMIDNGKTVPFKFHFGAPSCVPATIFETAGAVLNVNDVDALLKSDDVFYLSEMMNFPGVLNDDDEVLKKIASSKKYNKPVDGHAPGLMGELAKKYIYAGITTDHECFTAAEALDKLKYGMKILIREGSAAKNFDALIDLMHEHYEMMMLCSDDKHPDSLADGHINQLCARAVAKDIDIFKVLQAACINPALHYKMKVGLLREGDAADFIVVEDLENFTVVQTYIDGELVAENGKSLISSHSSVVLNNFDCSEKDISDFRFQAPPILPGREGKGEKYGRDLFCIEALDGQLITNKIICNPIIKNGFYECDIANDILKIVVVNRYKNALVAKAFIKNFGLQQGAIASSVAHDSHNIVAVGVDDESICKAVNLVIKQLGGISAVKASPAGGGLEGALLLPLPVAGLMSNEDGYKVAAAYTAIDKMVKEELGSTLSAPFMTLSFMALLVIPHLKLSDLGLFDGDGFKLIGNN
jgi:adenine deaminase